MVTIGSTFAPPGTAAGDGHWCTNEPNDDTFFPINVPPYVDGLVGVDSGQEGSTNITLCLALTATGTPILDERIVIVPEERDPGRSGGTLALRYCSMYTTPTCQQTDSVGAETEGPVFCGGSVCLGETTVWPGATTIGETGLSQALNIPPHIQSATEDCVEMICPLKIDFGRIFVRADGDVATIHVCLVLPPSPAPNGGLTCPTLIG